MIIYTLILTLGSFSEPFAVYKSLEKCQSVAAYRNFDIASKKEYTCKAFIETSTPPKKEEDNADR